MRSDGHLPGWPRVAGIPLQIHWSVGALAAVVLGAAYYQGGVGAAAWNGLALVLVFAVVVLHELGHSLAARGLGLPVRRILLLPIGGVAEFVRLPARPGHELWVTAAGPLVNFFLFAALWLGLGRPDPRAGFFAPGDAEGLALFLMSFNLAMGLFNLLPIYPMDGGRLLRAALWWRLSYLRATRVAVYTARLLGAVAVAWALWRQHWQVALVFGAAVWFGEREWAGIRRAEALRGRTARDWLRTDVLALPAGLSAAEAAALLPSPPPLAVAALEAGRVVALMDPAEIRQAALSPAVPALGDLGQPPALWLQADWPGEFAPELFHHGAGTRFLPVVDGAEFLGVLDLRELRRAWR